MKELKSFIKESKIYDLDTTYNFPGRSVIQPGYWAFDNKFGVLLCPPSDYTHIARNSSEIISRAKSLGFKVRGSFLNYAEGADITSESEDKYTLFAPAGESEAFWIEIGNDVGGVEVVNKFR